MNRQILRFVSVLSVVMLALASARLIAQDPRFALLVVGIMAGFVVPGWLAQRRMRQLLLSGDVRKILGTWQASLRRVTYPETMAPLLTATAYAAYGFIDAARQNIERAARGPAWEAAMEQRLFVDTLLDVYEGERDRAMTRASELERLPLPPAGFWMKRKIAKLRRGIAALARAFAHASEAEDDRALRSAARSSPLVHWAMRYARAIVLVDRGRKNDALALIADAPAWPEESAFHAFHSELITSAAS
ncbi:hypothetical protein AKJ09_06470 [Labilithrix luteola]|uniref:Tetratricopeptide repeat protein n=1 Tax=Labilithrix luteola TaxID=1391654 RepID=A0A0K1Q2D9_9BACT|nr:hypothetical protein [Labilithrix luteola]AKU99806.1 hypothetical protein AKJ09_06470 [Labilithrix luteola]